MNLRINPDNSKYITTLEFNKLTAEYFEGRLKQANLVNKSNFSNITKCSEVHKN